MSLTKVAGLISSPQGFFVVDQRQPIIYREWIHLADLPQGASCINFFLLAAKKKNKPSALGIAGSLKTSTHPHLSSPFPSDIIQPLGTHSFSIKKSPNLVTSRYYIAFPTTLFLLIIPFLPSKTGYCNQLRLILYSLS